MSIEIWSVIIVTGIESVSHRSSPGFAGFSNAMLTEIEAVVTGRSRIVARMRMICTVVNMPGSRRVLAGLRSYGAGYIVIVMVIRKGLMRNKVSFWPNSIFAQKA